MFYVFWKCNIGSKSYVGIVITSKDIFKQMYMYIANFELLPLLKHSTDMENIPPINAQDSVIYTIRYAYSLNMFREKILS